MQKKVASMVTYAVIKSNFTNFLNLKIKAQNLIINYV
jgi:hypothetical protein